MFDRITDELKATADFVESALEKRINTVAADKMAEAMSYSLLGGGKRIRAFLTVEFCKMFGGSADDAEAYACAVEMVHAYSLIHDDLPCMDNDDMRRGKPSCHKAYGETVALLAGDALLTYAFETAASGKNNPSEAVRTLAYCAGAQGMCRGQEIDLALECNSYDELVTLHSLKTGALINAAATLGYLASGAQTDRETLDKIKKYSLNVGLAFQIIDDLLDMDGDPLLLGKSTGSDEKNEKSTLVKYIGKEKAIALASDYSERAKDMLYRFNDCEARTRLFDFCDKMLRRKR